MLQRSAMKHFYLNFVNLYLAVGQMCVCVCVCVCVSSVMPDSLWPHELWPYSASIHGNFQAGLLEQVAMPSSRAFS